MPMTRNTAAARNAAEYECVPATMNPVTSGAAIPAIWLLRFMMPPTVPTLWRGEINDGMDQPTGAAMESPVMETAIQKTAACVVSEYATPKIPRPNDMPDTRTVCRTRTAFQPRWINASTSQPPTTSSPAVAHNHGIAV